MLIVSIVLFLLALGNQTKPPELALLSETKILKEHIRNDLR